jgi:RNA 2',3'-cyclic 3'-phosphodiesterase
MRIFIAAFVTAADQDVLGRRLRALIPAGYRLVPPRNLHVTLRFLGHVDDAQLERLRGQLQHSRPDVPRQCTASATAIRALPSPRRPRVLAVSLSSDGLLERVAADLCDALIADFGAPDRAFHPHITFARSKGHSRPLQTLPHLDEPTAVCLEEFGVYRSDTLREGAAYRQLFSLA